jgi:hypothetical protein
MMLLVLLLVAVAATGAWGAAAPPSDATSECLDCHASVTPGIVADWKNSRMAKTTVAAALKQDKLARRISVTQVPAELADVAVGCYECHSLNGKTHKDTFAHNGFNIHTVVTPLDCAVCHAEEVKQYGDNVMSQAYGNLMDNVVHKMLVDAINGISTFDGAHTGISPHGEATDAESCLYCHGTIVEATGSERRETEMGEMTFPKLSGWPNQGVGRINPDGSEGSCSSCHARHQFSITVARQPYTCSECHKGPDVPAYKVYSVSKHGNIFTTQGKEWDFTAVPWTVGEDFSAPTCAVCHVSLLTDGNGNVIAERTHRMNDRQANRLFGVYSTAHPKSADTTVIRNKAGLPLPAELTGEPAVDYLIDAVEQERREHRMKQVCLACHSRTWVDNQFVRLKSVIAEANAKTLTATKILATAWEKGAAKGLSFADGLKVEDSIFNEMIEKMWVEHWLFYANSTRYAAAMGGADYGVFADGRWYLNKNIEQMADWLAFRLTAIEALHPGKR